MATKEEKQILGKMQDALTRLGETSVQQTSDIKYILLTLDKQEIGQKDINKSMFSLHEKTDKRLDALETEIIAAKNKVKGLAWGAALGGGTGGAGLFAFLSQIFKNGGG